MALSLTALENSLAAYKAAWMFYQQHHSAEGSLERQLLRDAIIQRFEFTFEISWKTLKRYFETFGLEQTDGLTNRDFFRVAFEQGLIRDSMAWLAYLQNRNLTSHTYNEATAQQVQQTLDAFIDDVTFLLNTLQEKINARP